MLMEPTYHDIAQMTDEQLITYALRGDEYSDEPITELISRYMPIVTFKARQMSQQMSFKDLDVDDLAQEGMLGLLGAIRTYRSDRGSKFSTYANVCISNRMKTAVSKSGRSSIIPRMSDEFLMEGRAAHQQDNNPEDIVIDKEKSKELSLKINRALSELERETLYLFLKGYNYDQMANQLITSRKAVDNALQRVRRKLKSVFKSGETHHQ